MGGGSAQTTGWATAGVEGGEVGDDGGGVTGGDEVGDDGSGVTGGD